MRTFRTDGQVRSARNTFYSRSSPASSCLFLGGDVSSTLVDQSPVTILLATLTISIAMKREKRQMTLVTRQCCTESERFSIRYISRMKYIKVVLPLREVPVTGRRVIHKETEGRNPQTEQPRARGKACPPINCTH